MVFAALALYFLAMVAIAAVLLLPSVRERCVAAARAQWRRLTAGATMVGARSAGTLRESVDSAASNASAFKQFVVRRRALLLGALGVLSVPPMLALALRERQSFEFDDDTVREPDPHISALLNGERLIPAAAAARGVHHARSGADPAGHPRRQPRLEPARCRLPPAPAAGLQDHARRARL